MYLPRRIVSKPETSYPKTMKKRGLHSEKEPPSSVISNGGEESLEASEALSKESSKQLVPGWNWGQLVTLGCWSSFRRQWKPCSATLPLSVMSTGSPWRWHAGWSLDILIHCICIHVNINWCLKLPGVPIIYMYMCRYSVGTCTCIKYDLNSEDHPYTSLNVEYLCPKIGWSSSIIVLYWNLEEYNTCMLYRAVNMHVHVHFLNVTLFLLDDPLPMVTWLGSGTSQSVGSPILSCMLHSTSYWHCSTWTGLIYWWVYK